MMMDWKNVKTYLCMLEQWNPEDAEPWDLLIQSAAGEVSRRAKREPGPGDDRLIRAAAGWAAYQIALCRDTAGDVTSFQAGDVSVTARDSGAQAAKQRCDLFFRDAASLFKDDSFAFLEV